MVSGPGSVFVPEVRPDPLETYQDPMEYNSINSGTEVDGPRTVSHPLILKNGLIY